MSAINLDLIKILEIVQSLPEVERAAVRDLLPSPSKTSEKSAEKIVNEVVDDFFYFREFQDALDSPKDSLEKEANPYYIEKIWEQHLQDRQEFYHCAKEIRGLIDKHLVIVEVLNEFLLERGYYNAFYDDEESSYVRDEVNEEMIKYEKVVKDYEAASKYETEGIQALERQLEESAQELARVTELYESNWMEHSKSAINPDTKQPMKERAFKRLARIFKYSVEQMIELESQCLEAEDKNEELAGIIEILDDLGEGFRMGHVEQLRSETKTLAEKIEEKNDELTAMRFRAEGNTQYLAHIREKSEAFEMHEYEKKLKLSYLQGDVVAAKRRVVNLKSQLSKKRMYFHELRRKAGLRMKPELWQHYLDTVKEIEKQEALTIELEKEKERVKSKKN